jgi:hypothetical protein
MATTSSEITWLCFLLIDLQVSHSHVVVLHCDNKAALHIALNLVFHERTKHIELDCHFICDKIQEGILITAHVSIKCQLIDVFTEANTKRNHANDLSEMPIGSITRAKAKKH